MTRPTRDRAYDSAQSRLTREAADAYGQPDWGEEDPRMRRAYDRELRRSMRVDGKGRKSR
jgi:hypothetical protein